MTTNSINARLDRLEKSIACVNEISLPTFIFVGSDREVDSHLESRKLSLAGKYLGINNPTPESVSAALVERFPEDIAAPASLHRYPAPSREERQKYLESLLTHKATLIRRGII